MESAGEKKFICASPAGAASTGEPEGKDIHIEVPVAKRSSYRILCNCELAADLQTGVYQCNSVAIVASWFSGSANIGLGGIASHHAMTVEESGILCNRAFHDPGPAGTVTVVQG